MMEKKGCMEILKCYFMLLCYFISVWTAVRGEDIPLTDTGLSNTYVWVLLHLCLFGRVSTVLV